MKELVKILRDVHRMHMRLHLWTLEVDNHAENRFCTIHSAKCPDRTATII